MKRDRAERMVEKVVIRQAWDGMGPVVLQGIALMLLRREQVWMKRMAKKLPRILCVTTRGASGEAVLLDDILAALAKRKGGW